MNSGDIAKNLCFFGNHLSKADTAVNGYVECDDVQTQFLSIDDLDLREMIMARCCIKHINE